MASFPDLRPYLRSASAESGAVPRFNRLPLLAAFAVVSTTAFFAVSELATLRGTKARTTPAFLTRTGGAAALFAFLVGNPAEEARAA